MVLLTYHPDSPGCNGVAAPTDKGDGPKTAYIDKLYKFNDSVNAVEQKCDLFFLCQDGEVPAHRLVICNASKYIMAMQDDQSPRYPVYISVPDLNTDLVQTLVQLAYTGEMNLPTSYTSDDLLDAMQALGWVNSDALTATYKDSQTEEEIGSPLTRTRESVETLTKMNLPSKLKPKLEADTSDASEDEGGMEIDVPDLPMSDEDDKNDTKQTRKGPGRRANKRTKAIVAKKDSPKSNNLKQKKTVAESPKKEPAVSPAKSEARRRGGRKNAEDETETQSVATSQVSTIEVPSSVATSPEAAVRSRTRTIRKPKKFEDSIVLTPTKRKESPTKALNKSSTNDAKIKAQPEELSNNNTLKRNAPNKALKPAEKINNSVASTSRTRRSESASSDSKDTPKNSLITSYFSKRSPRRSNDCSPPELNAEEATVENHEKTTEKGKVQNSDVPNLATSRTRRTASKDAKKTEDDASSDPTDSTSTASLRNRARSTASNKSDVPQEDGTTEPATKTLTRRKRNLQESQSSDATPADEAVNPTRRGRRASAVSIASSKDLTTDGILEDPADNNIDESSKKKRTRPE